MAIVKNSFNDTPEAKEQSKHYNSPANLLKRRQKID